MIAGLGENQDTPTKRINSWRKGYMKGQPDIIIANYHKEYTGLCIEFKSPTNNYQISETQREMKSRYKQNGYRFLISNDYDHIITYLNKHMMGQCVFDADTAPINSAGQRKRVKYISKVSIRNKYENIFTKYQTKFSSYLKFP